MERRRRERMPEVQICIMVGGIRHFIPRGEIKGQSGKFPWENLGTRILLYTQRSWSKRAYLHRRERVMSFWTRLRVPVRQGLSHSKMVEILLDVSWLRLIKKWRRKGLMKCALRKVFLKLHRRGVATSKIVVIVICMSQNGSSAYSLRVWGVVAHWEVEALTGRATGLLGVFFNQHDDNRLCHVPHG